MRCLGRVSKVECEGRVTIFELNGDGFVGAFHQESVGTWSADWGFAPWREKFSL